MSPQKQPTLTDETKVRTTLGALLAIATMTAASAAAWTWSQATLRDHTEAIRQHGQRIDAVEAKASNDHDILLEIRGDVKALMREKASK